MILASPATRHGRRTRQLLALALASGLLMLTACSQSSRLLFDDGVGTHPRLPPAEQHLIPTVHVAKAVGWPVGVMPDAAAGLSVLPFARGLDHPRWVHVLPNGDVLVAETNAPPKPQDGKGIKGWVMKLVMRYAGAGTPSANRITLLRDADGDGFAETRSVLLEGPQSGLHSPFGMALVGERLYVANTDAIVWFPYVTGQLHIDAAPATLVELPAGPINHHWTRNVIASADGQTLYVTVGSNSNVAENGIEQEQGRAAIWEVDIATGAHRIFASGLRNPNGMGWAPASRTLWTVVNERDELGSDLVPDYLTSVHRGAFYGWPYSYFGAHVDSRVQAPSSDLAASAVVPDYALGTHVAPLGMAFSEGQRLGPLFAHGVFVGEHGSWNRKPHSGYKVVFVPFDGAQPSGALPLDVLTGFVRDGDALGRPVGVAIDRRGALLVADDVGNTIWRVDAAATH